jgi:hypothetical protein
MIEVFACFSGMFDLGVDINLAGVFGRDFVELHMTGSNDSAFIQNGD